MLKIKVRQNLTLKHLQVKEAKQLFDFIEKNRDHFKKWLNWVNFIRTIEHEKQYLKSLSQDEFKAPSIDLGIWLDDVLVGTMGITNIDRLNKSASLGYCLDEDYQHKGIITDCCQKFLNFAFNELGLHRIEIKTTQTNFRSKAVARRLGFKHEGTLRQAYYINSAFLDCELFSKLKPEIR